MKKILYLMSVDWYWIKQRPQILAEHLSKDFDVTVVYLKEVFCKQQLRKDRDELEKSFAVPALPYRDKNVFVHIVQKAMFNKIMKRADEFDIIWVGQPLLYNYIPVDYKGKIIYDCMDNHEALCGDLRIKKVIHETEKKLVRKASIIFASSTGLYSRVQSMGGIAKTVLIRNGFVADKILPPIAEKHTADDAILKVGYFGTIAEWFDFSLLLKSLELFPNVEYYLWGPISGIVPPEHPRIKIKGVVEHSKLGEAVADMDALIMPFKINDIIKDVDPVKLYEYVSMGKNIISVFYGEVMQFEPFVNFYNSFEEYCRILTRLVTDCKPVKYNSVLQVEFLNDNSWEKRYQRINKEIGRL